MLQFISQADLDIKKAQAKAAKAEKNAKAPEVDVDQIAEAVHRKHQELAEAAKQQDEVPNDHAREVSAVNSHRNVREDEQRLQRQETFDPRRTADDVNFEPAEPL